MKFSESLLSTIASVRSQGKAIDLADRSKLIANQVFVYHMIRASSSLLRVAAEHSTGELHEFFVEHLAEEQQHDKWLAEDLLTAGIDVTKTDLPRLAVEAAGSQYYFVHHVDPAMLLGYMAVLECFPMSEIMLDTLEELHGKALLRTARHHALNDPQHGREILNTVDSLTDLQQGLILQNAIQTAVYLNAAHGFIQQGRSDG